jgi:uncharacterized membrane protein
VNPSDVEPAVMTAAVVLTGLVAGLFAAFDYCVMPGLRRVADDAFVATMRGINVAIINPVFGVVFGGALVAAGAAVAVSWSEPTARWWATAGFVLYVGTLAITGLRNVPLNEALEDGPLSSTADASALRAEFERSWTRWNLTRTATSCGAFFALVVAAVQL